MRSKAWLVLAGVVAAVSLGAAGLSLRLRGAGAVPVLTVAPGPFVRRVRAEGNLKTARATPLTAPGSDASFKIAWMAEDGVRVKKGDVVVRFDPTEIEKALAAGEADRGTVGERIGREKAESGGAIRNLGRDADQARRELETARTFQSKDPELYSRHAILEADIDVDLSERRERHAASSRVLREQIRSTNLELLGIDRGKADLVIGKALREKAALEVIAPHDGLVVFQRDWRGELPQVGQSVWSGYPLAEIPDLAQQNAEVWVLEADAGGLAVGRPATVYLDAHPDVPWKATVRRVDALAKPRQRGVPVQYFGVSLELEKTDPALMKPGERVGADLELGSEENVLAVPRQAIFDRGGRKVVYRRSGRDFTPVTVELGSAAVGRVVVTKGLAPGDVVALRDPSGSPATSGPQKKAAPELRTAAAAGGRS